MSDQDLEVLAEKLWTKFQRRLDRGRIETEPLPFRLTVRQFATCIQRCEATVRLDIRARKIEAEGRPYLIPPTELSHYQVEPGVARGRLRAAGLWPAA